MFIFTRSTLVSDVVLIEPQVFWDERGFFMETYNKKDFESAWTTSYFSEDNYKKTDKWSFVWFSNNMKTSLIRVINWSIFVFIVDVRKKSSTYWKHIVELLSAENKRQLLIPKWLTYSIVALEEWTKFIYKYSDL